MKSAKKWISLLTIIAAAGLMSQFQNCTLGKAARMLDTQKLGGGGGYDGKTYAGLADNACPDKSLIKTRIIIENGLARIVRENCQDLADADVRTVDAVVNGQEATVGGQTLALESVAPTEEGEFTTSALGEYAPAVSWTQAGAAENVRGAPLGQGK